MRVLVTGMAAPQVGSLRVPLKYATGVKALVETLRSVGHEVDQRGVLPGEKNLHEYDRVIVYLGPSNALTSTWTYGAMWTLDQRPDAAVALDDHQTHNIITGARTQTKDTSRLWKTVFNRYGRELCTPAISRVIEKQISLVAECPWPWKIIAPVFPHGDVRLLGLTSSVGYFGFDPSPFWTGHYGEVKILSSSAVKEKVWISASLLSKQPWLEKQKFTWPVTMLGNKKLGQPRLKEHNVVKFYAQSWGVLSAPHRHVGSGWWRARYVFSADAGCILYGNVRETGPLGTSYSYPLETLECQTDKGLLELAHQQRQELAQKTWTKEQLEDALDSLVTVG